MKRIITVIMGNEEEVEEFLRLINERIKSNIYVDVKNTKIRIRVYGDEIEVKEVFNKIKELEKEVKYSFHPDRKGFYHYVIPLLFSNANIRVAFPYSLVVDILQTKGIEAYVDGIYLIAKISKKDLVKILQSISNAYYDSLKYPLTPMTRRAIVFYSIIRGQSIEKTIKVLLNKGFLKKRGEVYWLTINYEQFKKRISNAPAGI